MSNILIDSSVWIDYFRGSNNVMILDQLIDTNQICTNDLILAELIPFLLHRNETDLVEILNSINKIPLYIDWNEIIEFQTENIRNGINNIGIPDLIIVQNVRKNGLQLFSSDKHFELMKKHITFKMFSSKE
jgi:predicted nucleic acid-binding protein